jgi:hypothetical protein
VRERRGPTPARLLPSLCRASTRLSCRVFACSYARTLVRFSLSSPSFFLSFSRGALDTPFYRRKEVPSYTKGCSWELTWLAGKCPEPCTDNNVAVGGVGASRVGVGIRFFGSVRFLGSFRNSVLQKLEPK